MGIKNLPYQKEPSEPEIILVSQNRVKMNKILFINT